MRRCVLVALRRASTTSCSSSATLLASSIPSLAKASSKNKNKKTNEQRNKKGKSNKRKTKQEGKTKVFRSLLIFFSRYAMESGEYAADVLYEALLRGDLSAKQLKKYQDKWYKEFGREFFWSMKMSLFLYRFPILLDAAAKLIGKRGARFLADWAQVMTGTQSKLWFVRPDVGPLLVLEAIGIAVRRALGLPEQKN